MVEITPTSNDGFEYFAAVKEHRAEPEPPYSIDQPSGLWRKHSEQWEYLSLIDWQWHASSKAEFVRPPVMFLHPIVAARAAELEADMQGFVRYWAYYPFESTWHEDEAPSSVVRSRRSPENVLDEVFGRGNKWIPTAAVYNFVNYRASNRPHLIPISLAEADRLLYELCGVRGVTAL